MCHFLVYRFVSAFIKQFPLVLIIFRYAAMKWNAQQNDSQKYIWQTCTLQIFLSLSCLVHFEGLKHSDSLFSMFVFMFAELRVI